MNSLLYALIEALRWRTLTVRQKRSLLILPALANAQRLAFHRHYSDSGCWAWLSAGALYGLVSRPAVGRPDHAWVSGIRHKKTPAIKAGVKTGL